MVIYNLIKFSDHKRFSFSILVQRSGEQDQIFEELGCKIIIIPFTSLKKYRQDLVSLFTKNTFIAVHAHMHNEMGEVLKIAELCGVRHRIAHSHNARVDIPNIFWPLRFFKHHRFEKNATDFFGCSELALRWLFPLNWRKGKIVYNAIDLSSFSYNASQRVILRKEYNVSQSTKIVINVGRCTDQKNQSFIIERAKDLKEEDILFVIIGEGPLFNNLNQRVQEDNLNNVVLLGKRFDVAAWLCAADLFLLPSVYEGLGIVAIEAQATGLPVLATDTIPAEADMGMSLFCRIPLSDTEVWNSKIRSLESSKDRSNLSKQALVSHYNILTVAKEVDEVYLN